MSSFSKIKEKNPVVCLITGLTLFPLTMFPLCQEVTGIILWLKSSFGTGFFCFKRGKYWDGS